MTTPLHDPKLYHIRDLFLFSCYTGIPYGDMCRLTTEDLEVAEDGEVWIKTARKKTKIDYEVPLLDIPLLILDKYRDMAPEGKLLPMYSNNELNRTLKRIAAICGGKFSGCDSEVRSVVTDSRSLSCELGCRPMFVAMRGANHDSHDFIAGMQSRGVRAFLGERGVEASSCTGECGFVQVGSAIAALQRLAAYHRAQFRGTVVGITGSNGKTTTTSLIYKIMRDAGMRVALGGNIGESFAYSVATGDYDWYVLELSSFQLDGMFRFRAHIGVLTNITPDHLDRYDYCFQNYVDAKMRITQNQNSRDFFIYSGDAEVIWQQMPKYDLRMKQLPFAAKNAVASGAGDAFLLDGKFTATVGRESVEIDTAKMRIPGLHNAYNAMAAALAALAAGVSPTRIRSSIYDFAPVEHRLEPAGEIGGVTYINDSKATNVDSTWYALESMKRPVVWIAGGTDKGNDYEPLKRFAREKVHTLVCMGIDNRKLVESFTGIIPEIISTDSLDAAMQAARKASRPGDVVLLSPACASFDLFKNYENRGELFKQWVAEHAK